MYIYAYFTPIRSQNHFCIWTTKIQYFFFLTERVVYWKRPKKNCTMYSGLIMTHLATVFSFHVNYKCCWFGSFFLMTQIWWLVHVSNIYNFCVHIDQEGSAEWRIVRVREEKVYMSGPSVREEIYFVHCARVNGDVWNIIDF